MAHFPEIKSGARAARFRIPNNEKISFNLGGRKVSATLHMLSLTGGLVEFPGPLPDLSLAEVTMATTAGTVTGLVEFLKPQRKNKPSQRPFRFVAMDDQHYKRLSNTLTYMRQNGIGT